MSAKNRYPLMQTYVAMMQLVVERLTYLDPIFKKSMSEGLEFQEMEVIALHLRLSFETIVLATFIANRKSFERMQSNLVSKPRFRQILDEAKKLNPDFYPKPCGFGESSNELIIPPDDLVYLTESDMKAGMSLCHRFMHPRNPFSQPIPGLRALEEFFVLREKTIYLLKTHQIRLANDDGFFLVQLMPKDRDSATFYRLEPTSRK